MVPDTSFTLNAFCICQRAHARVGAETLPPVTHPGFTEITDCTLQPQQDSISGLLQHQQRLIPSSSMYPSIHSVNGLPLVEWEYWIKPVFSPSCLRVHVCLLFISAGLSMMQNNLVIYLNSGFYISYHAFCTWKIVSSSWNLGSINNNNVLAKMKFQKPAKCL